MKVQVLELLLCRGILSPNKLRVPFTPIMENQMEKNMENEMETGIIRDIYIYRLLLYWG